MSVVVGIKEQGKIYMAADTMITYGDSKRYLRNEHTQKVWVVEDTPKCIMGCVGMLSDLNVVRYCSGQLVPELNVLKNDINIGTIIVNTVPQITGVIADYGKICNKPADLPLASSFLLGINDHLFSIYPDGTVEEEEDYVAIGSGADMAIASLQDSEGEDVYVRLIKAVEAAAKISLYVGGPYVIVNNEDCEMLMITSNETIPVDELEAKDLDIEPLSEGEILPEPSKKKSKKKKNKVDKEEKL